MLTPAQNADRWHRLADALASEARSAEPEHRWIYERELRAARALEAQFRHEAYAEADRLLDRTLATFASRREAA